MQNRTVFGRFGEVKSASVHPLRIAAPKTEVFGDTLRTGVRLHLGEESEDLWFECPAALHHDASDPFLLASLIPAMSLGADLQVEGSVAPGFPEKLDPLQDVYQMWFRGSMTPIAIEAPANASNPPDGPRGVGAFFTGGVDSFYTLIDRMEEITHLVYVWGFDIKRSRDCRGEGGDAGLREPVTRMLEEVAAHYGKTLVQVETNLRDPSRIFHDVYSGGWQHHALGAGASSVAALLSRGLRKVYLPASLTYADLFPWGTHPFVDPLWCPDHVELVDHGAGKTRFEKTEAITREQDPLRWLRVCFENRGGAYNCGRCEKCVRTMTSFRVLGRLDEARTFETPLALWRVLKSDIQSPALRGLTRENLDAVERRGGDPLLAAALRFALAGWLSHGAWRWARQKLRTARRRRRMQARRARSET